MASTPAALAHEAAARRLVAIGRRFYRRAWVLGTSGNFSAVLTRDPLTLAITPSGAHKGAPTISEILAVDANGHVVGSSTRRPSAETALHLTVARRRSAGAVLHTHSVWGTILSESHATARGMALEGYEMLKGLDGVTSHRHREWVPIVDNDQDIQRLAAEVDTLLARATDAHAFLIRGHGLYTWGATLDDAERHVEILEFLFETVGRRGHYGDRHDS
jgi:methylthioribulose-1-phosphate dehydratase